MNSLFLPLKLGFSVLCLVFNLLVLQCCASSNVSWYQNCGSYFSCGNKLNDIGYPFWGGARPKDCGYPALELTCKDNNVTVIEIMGQEYQVLGVNKNDQTINILREDINANGICLKELVNTTLDFSLFDYTTASMNLTMLYGCPSSPEGYPYPDPTQFTCSVHGSNNTGGHILFGSVGPSVRGCYTSVVVPVMANYSAELQSGNLGAEGLIAKGFEVKYMVDSQACENCTSSNGRCGYDLKANKTTCICSDGHVALEYCGYNETSSSPKIRKGMFIRSLCFSFGLILLIFAMCLKI